MNKAAFQWGRRTVVDPAAVAALIKPAPAAKADEAAVFDQFRAGPAPLLKAAE